MHTSHHRHLCGQDRCLADPAPAVLLRSIALIAVACILAACGSAPSVVDDHPGVRITNLGGIVNSPEDDFAPSITANGSMLFFTSGRPDPDGRTQRDFWMSRLDGGFWTTPTNVGPPINTAMNEGTPSISSDGQTLYFAACDRAAGFGRCDLFTARRDGKSWTDVRPLPAPVNSGSWDAQPSISSDGTTLFFASDRGGGQGGVDIWMAKRTAEGAWSSPVNLGPDVNTSSDDVSPFIAADGRTLYFSSAGHGGLGGTDMFAARLVEGHWGQVRNLGSPLNSPNDDEFFTAAAEGSVITFASRREGGFGGLDLYRAEPNPVPPDAVVVVSGTVRDARTKAPVAASLRVSMADGRGLYGEWTSNAYSGEYVCVLPAGASYTASVTADGYATADVEMDFSTQRTYLESRKDILLKKDENLPTLSATVTTDVTRSDFSLLRAGAEAPGLTVENVLAVEYIPILNYVFFEEESAVIPSRYPRLNPDMIADFRSSSLTWATLPKGTLERYRHILNLVGLAMTSNPALDIDLTGTTDGIESGGRALALQRAEAVRAYLSEVWGISAARMKVKGRELPAAPSSSALPEGREENRRVEITAPGQPSFPRPLEISSTEQLIKPDKVVFHLSIEAAAGIRDWFFSVRNGDAALYRQQGSRAYPDSIVWDWRDESGALPAGSGNLQFSLEATDMTGRQIRSETGSIPVRTVELRQVGKDESPDHLLERFSLILFDFDRSELDERNARNLKSVAPKLTPKSTVLIRGFTDALGEEQHNMQLSAKRAESVREALRRSMSGVQLRSEGVGESMLLYPNDQPEGRFYCRTVQILIETRK